MRKRKYHAPQVRRLQDQGYKPKEIAMTLNTSRQYVYTVRTELKKKAKARALKAVKIVPVSRFEKFKKFVKGLFRG